MEIVYLEPINGSIMFLVISSDLNIIFTILFCILFVVSFLVLQASRIEECFKKGSVWQIRVAYFILSFVFAFLITYGIYFLAGLIII